MQHPWRRFMATGAGYPAHLCFGEMAGDSCQRGIGAQLQSQADVAAQCLFQGLVESYRFAQVAAPIETAVQLGVGQRLAAESGDQRDVAWACAQGRAGLLELIENRIKQPRMRGAGDIQAVATNP